MALSHDLISQFAKVVNSDKKTKSESTSYGTAVVVDGATYVKLDGSDLLTPVETTTVVKDKERVAVSIKNHTATITGNFSSPSARNGDVQDLGDRITEVDELVAKKVSTEYLQANYATIENLNATNAKIDNLEADHITASSVAAKYATIENLNAANAKIDDLDATKIDAEVADIKYATIESLEATDAKVNNLDATYATIVSLDAQKARIDDLDANKLSATQADLKYANIDFTNIGKAAIENFYATSGIIKDLVVGDTSVTGRLVGVTITGDLIEGGTVKADKLVILGEDGLYYKLNANALGETTAASDPKYQNGLDGSVIVAKSITAEKVNVHDLVAFDATIGGFNISDNAIYSGVKNSVSNTTSGVILQKDGQIAFGDGDNFICYRKKSDGTYVLEISANTIDMAISGAKDEAMGAINDLSNDIENNYVGKNDFTDKTAELSGNIGSVDAKYENIPGDLESYKQSSNDEIQAAKNATSNLVNKLNQYFVFGSNGLTIGLIDNPLKLVLDNSNIGFTKNGTTISYWTPDDFYVGNIKVVVNRRAQFGNFAFVPRSDGSLMFLKVGG